LRTSSPGSYKIGDTAKDGRKIKIPVLEDADGNAGFEIEREPLSLRRANILERFEELDSLISTGDGRGAVWHQQNSMRIPQNLPMFGFSAERRLPRHRRPQRRPPARRPNTPSHQHPGTSASAESRPEPRTERAVRSGSKPAVCRPLLSPTTRRTVQTRAFLYHVAVAAHTRTMQFVDRHREPHSARAR